MIGGDLGKNGKMSLALGADPRCDADLAVRLHLNLGALVGTNTGAFDIASEAEAEMTALQARAALLFLEGFVADASSAMSSTGS
ncbi:MAG: hypothetical protein WDN50_11395 [Bradyrhizobium sp.]